MNRAPHQDRRMLILDAARKTIATRGFLGTRSKDVAREAQVSEGLLFRYFPSMRAIRAAVVAKGRKSRPAPWPPHLSDMPPRVALRAAGSAFLSVFVRDPALLRLSLFGALFGDSDSVEPYRREVRRTTRRIALLIRSWKKDGWVRGTVDPHGVACLFVSGLVHAVMTHDVFGVPWKQAPLESDIHAFVDLLKESDPLRRSNRSHPLRTLPRRRR